MDDRKENLTPSPEKTESQTVTEEVIVEETAVAPCVEVKAEESCAPVIDVVEEKAEESVVTDDYLVVTVPLVESKNGKAIINVDVISENFAAGETVSLEALKERNVIAPNVRFIKILARGVILKPVTVVADKYSKNARLAIENAGGSAN